VERASFLDNIARRLGRPRVHASPLPPAGGPPEPYRRSPLGTGEADRIERFRSELERVGARVTLTNSLAAAHLALRAEMAFWSAERVVSWSAEDLASWDLAALLQEIGCVCYRPGMTDFRARCLQAHIGITTVEFAVVNTGTLALSAGLGRPRMVSLLPSVHVALVRESQLVDRIGLAFAAYASGPKLAPSAVHFITGPSRTSDIENDLTIGVHGPAAVSIIGLRDQPSGDSR
jgi:L-lactate dehydrogenase complex protein LldG